MIPIQSHQESNMRRGKPSSCSGFTLIELLVVIAIIAILIAILMPSLQKAKDLADSTICLTNLKIFGTGFQMYATECDGDYPVIWYKKPGTPSNDYWHWYSNDLFRHLTMFNKTGINATDWPKSIFCRKATWANTSKQITHSYSCVRGELGYANNKYYFIRMERLSRPAYTVQMCDGLGAVQAQSGGVRYDKYDLYGEDFTTDGTHNTNRVAYRHDNNVNILHFDGHAQSYLKTVVGSVVATTGYNTIWQPETSYVDYPP